MVVADDAERGDVAQIDVAQCLDDGVVRAIHAEEFLLPGEEFPLIGAGFVDDGECDGTHALGVVLGSAAAHQIKQAGLASGAGFLGGCTGVDDLVEDRELLAACAWQCIEGAGLDETFDHAFVDEFGVDAIAEVFEAGEWLIGTRRHERLDRPFTHVFDGCEPKADATAEAIRFFSLIIELLDAEVCTAGVDIGTEHCDAQFGAFVDGFGDVFDLTGRGLEDGGHVRDGIVLLEVGGLVSQQAIERRVGDVEGIAREGDDELPELVCLGLRQAVFETAFFEARFFGGHRVALFFADGFEDDVGLTERITRDHLQELHDLLLVDDDAVGVFEDGFENGVQIFDVARVVFALNVDGDLVERTRSVECHHVVDVFDAIGFEFLEVTDHASRFELKDVDGLAATEGFEGTRVVERDVAQLHRRGSASADEGEGIGDDGQIAQTEDVHFEEADFGEGGTFVGGHQ